MFSFPRKSFLLALVGMAIACGSGDDKEGAPSSNSPLKDKDEFLVLEKSSDSKFTSESLQIFRDQDSWNNHYNLHRGNSYNPVVAPTIDFRVEVLAAIHLGARPNPGYSVNIITVTQDSTDNTIQIRYEEVIDATNVWPSVIAYPYAFVRLHASSLEYRFIKTGTRRI